ncbi:RloB domain-containing protein [Olsenella uli]|uniref:RloB family protein n=1 Tax=Olsenella uli TaxID=133926 RepID=UPI0019594292|nr:RloB family protein [Olsenella uli]MBM6816685.1 RloB domain-containing protein [Olsenella uli]
MAAKKRGWRSGRRSVATSPVQMTRHLIVCEGKETEPRYFEGMRDALGAANGRKVAVVVRGSGRHTLDLFGYAEDLCRYAPDPFDHVWLAFDKDDFPAADFDLVERRCAEASSPACMFHALWSNPCFEVWPLLHLRYTTAPMDAAGCQRALSDALSRELGVDYRKNMDGLFQLIDPMRDVAVGNAARLARHHEEIGNSRPSAMNPGTRVADIFGEVGPYLEGSGD